jgi:hypothetical protein
MAGRLLQGWRTDRRKFAGVILLAAPAAACSPAASPAAFPIVLSETPAAAQSVLTCDSIAQERAAIAASRAQIRDETLAERDAALAKLEASKGCRAY